MATVRDTYGNVIGHAEAGRFRDKYGDWVYALVDGGSGISGDSIYDTSGNRVGEIRGGYIYDTYGNRKAEIRGDRIYDTYGDWLFTID